ncbi:hypothetical protein BC941DRAFT_372694 [Chlamydoabsidia padenii]|nr:hypothetical protein BC941DRAFT_372694 [Chlamydoabsidia padenii]
MRFSVLSLSLLALFLFVCLGVNGNTSVVVLETNILVRRKSGTAKASPEQAPVQKAAKASTIWASPAILQDGTLFYIVISISTLLWCTGKGVDMVLDQQERKAEHQARR